MTEESLVFWIGALIFVLSSLMFAFLENRSSHRQNMFSSHVFVSFFTAISYFVMALALATVLAENGQPIYWTRWLFYIGSCSILTLDLAVIAKKTNVKKAEVAVFTALTMFCGFLASIIITVDRWWFFGLSTAAYIGMLYTLFKPSDEDSSNISSLMWFVFLTWSLFPVVWVLAPTGFGILAVDIEAILYLALDFVTKIGFGIYVSTKR
ncbi:MAG: microbial rhodopsin family protein [Candidatus Bathyarchaeota archaeon]|nr:microbial rhodopsin family protein [Candidatus Bathyarchaeota archaeon]